LRPEIFLLLSALLLVIAVVRGLPEGFDFLEKLDFFTKLINSVRPGGVLGA
jgi:hypothetical protein